MSEVSIEEVKRKALEEFNQADQETRKMLIGIFGKEAFPLTGMEAVQTFEDALKIVGSNDNHKILLDYNGTDKDMIAAQAYLKLTIIAKALNEGWTPDWSNEGQWKYYVWLSEYKSGSGFSCSDCVNSIAVTRVGSRLCYKSEELALYAGKKFRSIYNDLFTI